MRSGVLTGGGECPGLNAVIRAVVRRAEGHYGHTVAWPRPTRSTLGSPGHRRSAEQRHRGVPIADVAGKRKDPSEELIEVVRTLTAL